jgi:methionine synthase II (cobalamin-independent)
VFATLLGALPRPPLDDDASVEALVVAAVRAQEAAGIEPITDGGFHGQVGLLQAWRWTARLTDLAVKQVVTGPYTFGRSEPGSAGKRIEVTLARAATLNVALRDLAAAGCPLIEVHEPEATAIGADPAERSLFREAHLRLLEGLSGSHLSLAVTGGSADAAGIETILAAPYASLAVDLIAGPDNWRLVAVTPGDRGIVCGALPAGAGTADGPELLLWAAAYAASTGGRGSQRVGLATASSLAHLPWAVAVGKLERLGEAARLADLPGDARVRALDPRALSSRSAALGRVEPRPRRRPDRGHDPT